MINGVTNSWSVQILREFRKEGEKRNNARILKKREKERMIMSGRVWGWGGELIRKG